MVDGVVPSTLPVSSIQYQLSPILASYTSYTNLRGLPNTIENQTGNEYIYYTKSATKNGIVIGVTTLPSDFTVYELQVRVTVGQKPFIKTVNIILYNDSTPLHVAATSQPVQTALNALHQSLYGNSLLRYYKSDLLSLTGTLDMTGQASGLHSMLDANGNSLFNSLVNLNGLNVSGCNLFTGTLDLTNCKYITTVNTEGTSLGVSLGTGSAITSLSLGNPVSVSIVSPTSLTPSGVSAESYGNTTSVDIRNIPNAKTYSVFEKIFKNYIFGGTMTFGSYYYGGNNWQLKEVTGDSATKCWHTSDIELPNDVTTVTLQTSTPTRMVLFNKSDHSRVTDVSGSSGSI